MTNIPERSNIEHPESIYRRECAKCGTPMQPGKMLCPANSEHIGAVVHEYVPAEQLRGAVEALSQIAHAYAGDSVTMRSVAWDALTAMGVEPATNRGSRNGRHE